MSKVFYDRSGKVHVLGKKSETKEATKEARKEGAKKHSKGAEPSSKRAPASKKPVKGHQKKHSPAPRKEIERGSFISSPARKGEHPAKKHKKEGFVRAEPEFRGGRDAKGGRNARGGKKSKGGREFEARRPMARGRPQPRVARERIEHHPDWTKLKGIIDKNKRGSAFLIFDQRSIEDAFIPKYYIDQVFHGDRVEAWLNSEGEIEDLKVLEHRFKEIFGRIVIDTREEGRSKQKTRTGYLVYERKKAKEEVYVPSLPAEVKEGDWVKAVVVLCRLFNAASINRIADG